MKDYVREHRRRRRELFVPLAHPPGHAQADFGEARVVIGGVEQKAHFFAFDLPHSDACYVRMYRAATPEASVDGHQHAFRFFGSVPRSVLYDNDRCLVSRILPDGTRRRARLFSGFLSHYLIRDRYGRPGKGNDKGAVEGLVGWARRSFMVPVPRFGDFETMNRWLEARCRARQEAVLRGHQETIGERLARDREAMGAVPGAPFEACEQASGQVSSQSLVRYRTNDYSVPVAYGHRRVWVRGYVDRVVIGCAGEVIARHVRCYEREDMAFNPLHYLPLLERKCRCAGPGGAPGRMGTARGIPHASPDDGRVRGPRGSPRVRAGAAPTGDLRPPGSARGGQPCAVAGRHRLRCREAPGAVPGGTASAEARP